MGSEIIVENTANQVAESSTVSGSFFARLMEKASSLKTAIFGKLDMKRLIPQNPKTIEKIETVVEKRTQD